MHMLLPHIPLFRCLLLLTDRSPAAPTVDPSTAVPFACATAPIAASSYVAATTPGGALGLTSPPKLAL